MVARIIGIITKLALSAALILYVFNKIDAAAAFGYIKSLPAYSLILAISLMLAQCALASERLRTILSTVGSQLKRASAFNAVIIGAFFSQIIISFVGGDAMRIWYISRQQIPVGNAAKAVLYDRIFGFLGLIVIILIGLPFLFRFISHIRVHLAIMSLITAALIACTAILTMHRLPVRVRSMKLFSFAAQISMIGHSIIRSGTTFASLIAFSAGIQFLNVIVFYVISQGLRIHIDLMTLLVLVPPVLFLSMLPISIGGWGVRESAMIAALSTVDVPLSESLALSICYGLTAVLVSLAGGLLWLNTRQRPHPIAPRRL